MDFFESVLTAAGVPSAAVATLEQTGTDTWRVQVTGYGESTLTAADGDTARAAAEAWFQSQKWKRLTRWDPNTGAASSCNVLL